MHIPDNYLSPSTCATLFVAMTPIWYYSIRKINKTLSADKIPLIGIGGAFAFILMMFNLPIPDGTTAHAVGGTLRKDTSALSPPPRFRQSFQSARSPLQTP